MAPNVFVSSTSIPRARRPGAPPRRGRAVRGSAPRTICSRRRPSRTASCPSRRRRRARVRRALREKKASGVQGLIDLLPAPRRGVDDQVGPRHAVHANRDDALAHVVGEQVVVPEEMQPRLESREHLVDRGLPCVVAPAGAALVLHPEPARRLVGEQDVDAPQLRAGLHFLAHEVPPPVVARLGVGRAGPVSP